jgi:hypothetical protein
LLFAAPAAADWSAITAPQEEYDQPFVMTYDGQGNLYATTLEQAGPTSVFVRPPAGPFGSAFGPIAGNGATSTVADSSGRAVFTAYRGGQAKFNTRSAAGVLGSEANLGPATWFPTLAANNAGDVIFAWANGSTLNAQFRTAAGTLGADSFAAPQPTIGTSLLFPFVYVATDADGSGVIVYNDNSPGDGDLSFTTRNPGTSTWAASTPISGTTGTQLVTMHSNAVGDALVYWKTSGGNHASFRAHDTASFGADVMLPAGDVNSIAVQADGSALAVVAAPSTQDVTLYRLPVGGSGWTPISGPHTSLGDARVAASPTGDKVAFVWTQEPSNNLTHAYRVFAQVGTASNLGTATALPSQPETPGGSDNDNEEAAIAVDANGNAVALWRARRAGTPVGGHVFAAAFTGEGGPPPVDPPVDPPPPPPPPDPSDDPVDDLLGFDPGGTKKVGKGTIDVPVYCSPALPNPCTGNIVSEMGGSYSAGRALTKKPKAKKFSFKLPPVPFSVPPGQSTTVKIKLPKKAMKTLKKVFKAKGKATLTVQATLDGRAGEKHAIKLKR